MLEGVCVTPAAYRNRFTVALALLAMLGAACGQNEGANKREIEAVASVAAAKAVAEERARVAAAEADREAAIEREKQLVIHDPSTYLEARDIEVFDEGIIRRYREVVKLSVVNKAKWAVQDILGTVDWLDAGGGTLASATLRFKGSIPSGATQTFSMQDGTLSSTTIQSAAPRYRVRFTRVALLQSP